ncbi:hypothetical protein Tco_1005382 [Tanacetum coccineum]|uniref:Uncharacterized protein n=1 Tax=Tanacetum coccineum TaxID=301880 RepID=A0ABQ5FFT0_9ASTR
MEEGRINGNELKTELKEIRTQIIKLQKKRMPPKRTLTSETPAITLDVIRQLTVDFTTALEAQTAAMASASNLIRTPAVKTRNYKRVLINPKATANRPKKGATILGSASKSSSVLKNQPLKAIVHPTKEGNITMSNSYAALDDESKEDVENVYDESAN